MEGLKLFVSPMLGSVDSVFAEIGIEISYMSGEDAFGVSHQIPMNTPWNWIDINFTVESLVVTSQFYLAENDNPSEFAYVWEIGMKKLLLNTTSLVFPGIVIIPTFLYESVID